MQISIGNVQLQGHLGLLRHTPLKHFRYQPGDHSVVPRTLWQQIRLFEIKRVNTGTTATVTHADGDTAPTRSSMHLTTNRTQIRSTVTSEHSKAEQKPNSSANIVSRSLFSCTEVQHTEHQHQHQHQRQQIRELAQRIADNFQLSTTGYQSAMERLNNADRPDERSLMTMSRAQQYSAAAKHAYPSKTLFNLGKLQIDHIYRTFSNELLGAIEMSPEQITECLIKCREKGFANCDMQALEFALHLRYGLGFADFTIVSNHKLSHNYVVIHPCHTFPIGAIADTWTGQGLQELNFKTKLKFMHREENVTKNENMHEWLEKYGSQYFVGDATTSQPS